MRWTAEEEEYLKNSYGKVGSDEVAQRLGRSKSTISAKARSLGLSGRTGIWSEEDVTFLQENYLTLGAKETARRLGRTLSAVHSKIREVGGGSPSLGPRVDWTAENVEFLRENYSGLDLEELENCLDRTKSAIFHKAQELGIKRYVDPYPFFETWTEQSAYAVGFFAADGWVNKRGPESIRIGFSQKEPDIIYALWKTIGTGRITVKSDGMHEYYVQSTKTYEWLCDIFGHDVHKKAHTLRWPSVPERCVRHFTRGAFDGDGSIFSRKDGLWEMVYTTSSEPFVNSLAENTVKLAGVEPFIGLNKVDVYHARYVGLKAVCLADWLYRDSQIALKRKAQLAEEAYQTRNGRAYATSITPKMREMFPHIIDTYTVVG